MKDSKNDLLLAIFLILLPMVLLQLLQIIAYHK